MQCEICDQTMNEDSTTWEGHHICQSCNARILAYSGKVERRIDRLNARAEKTAAEAQAETARASQLASVIPFGQPILVGHHSERRDRNYRERIYRGFKRGYEKSKKAQYQADRAKAAEKNRAISSDDPAAVIKLQEKLDNAVKVQTFMKRVNKVLRKLTKAYDKANPGTVNDGSREDVTYHSDPKIRQARYDEVQAEREANAVRYVHLAADLATAADISERRAHELLTPDFMGRMGFPQYALTNNNANIRRMQKRIDGLKAQAVKRVEAEATGAVETEQDTDLNGVTVSRDLDDNRIRIHFPGKPDSTVRAILKQRGFRWSRHNMAWQRHLNNAGEYAVTQALKEIEPLWPTSATS